MQSVVAAQWLEVHAPPGGTNCGHADCAATVLFMHWPENWHQLQPACPLHPAQSL